MSTSRSTSPDRGRRLGRVLAASGLGLGLAVAAPLAASAHIGTDPAEVPQGGTTAVTFTVGHGCDGSATTAVTFTVPDAVAAAKPQVKAGYVTTVEDSTITFTAETPIPDTAFDTFTLRLTLDDTAAVGTTIAIPVLQTCESGSNDWSEVAAEGTDEPEYPAPTITVGEPTADGHGHGAVDAAGHDDDAGGTDAAAADGTGVAVAVGLGLGGLVLGAAGLVLGAVAVRRSRR